MHVWLSAPSCLSSGVTFNALTAQSSPARSQSARTIGKNGSCMRQQLARDTRPTFASRKLTSATGVRERPDRGSSITQLGRR